MSNLDALVRAFQIQSGACAAFGSPFSAAVLDRAAGDIGGGGALAALVAPWRGQETRALIGDAIPLRWLGCAHDLVLSGEAPAVAAAYPAAGRPGDAEAAWSGLRSVMASRPKRFAEFMGHEPQTNE